MEWPDVAHLPSMERPDDFAALVLDWVGASDRMRSRVRAAGMTPGWSAFSAA